MKREAGYQLIYENPEAKRGIHMAIEERCDMGGNVDGSELKRTQEPLAAIVPLAASVGLATNGFKAMYLLAEAYLQLGDKDRALEYADRTLEMKPDFKRASELKAQLQKGSDA